jgi:hypothetical protein
MAAARFHLAQINIATFRKPVDAPDNADFFDNIDRINQIADTSPGFVWRLVGDGGDATDIRVFDDPQTLVNMSVWEGPAELGAFVYRSGHLEIMRRRTEWFDDMETWMVLWWIPAGEIPTIADARHRLDLLAKHGPTPDAFTFRQSFPAPQSVAVPSLSDEHS